MKMRLTIGTIFLLSLLVHYQEKEPEKGLERVRQFLGLELQANNSLMDSKRVFKKVSISAMVPNDGQLDQIPMGEWKITKLTGSIKSTNSGPEPPEGLCENYQETYAPIAQYSFIELNFLEPPQDDANIQVNNVVTDFKEMITNVPSVDAARLFVFHFEFDNGHHSNEMLGAFQMFMPKVAIRADQTNYQSIPGGAFFGKLAGAFGGIEGYIGSWLPEDKSVYPGSTTRVVGIEGLQSGGGEKGKSLFWVTGKFDSPRAISGEWGFTEEAHLFDCTTISSGTGKWEAEPLDEDD